MNERSISPTLHRLIVDCEYRKSISTQLMLDELLGTLESCHVEDAMFIYFEVWQNNNPRDLEWSAIAQEARRLSTEIPGIDFEEDSLLDDFCTAIAAQAAKSAFIAIARALGVDPEHLESGLYEFYEQGAVDPIGFEGLKQRIEERSKE